jgi:capsular polysaccharide biosynthesis protein
MELKEYLRILKKEKYTLIVTVILSLAIGFIYSVNQTPGYKIERTFLIEATRSAVGKQTGSPADSSMISTQEEARNFTDTAVALLKDKSSLARPNISISAQKEAPQLIKVIVTAQNPQEAKVSLQKTTDSFNQMVRNLIQESIITLKPIGAEPEAVQNIIDINIILPLSFMAGLTLATLLISLKTFFRL